MAIVPGMRIGRKVEQVIEGARRVFLRDGYDGASVDDIARMAGVSKATLYSYFPDKMRLFTEVARQECRNQTDLALAEISQTKPPEQVLTAAATHLVRFQFSDFGLSLYRMMVAESTRFPEIGRIYYESGPMIVEDALTDYFTLACGRGELDIEDKVLAAHQFAELCKACLHPRALFSVQKRFSAAEFDRVIHGAVEMFLARYRADGQKRTSLSTSHERI